MLYLVFFHLVHSQVILEVEVKSLSHVRLFATPWTVAYHALLSMGFSRQEYWSGLPFPSPEDLPDPGIEPRSPAFYLHTIQNVFVEHPLSARLPEKSSTKLSIYSPSHSACLLSHVHRATQVAS